MIKLHESYMKLALKEAKKCLCSDIQDVPVGCVVVDSSTNSIICTSHNINEKKQNAVLHAEIDAVFRACNVLKKKYLNCCAIYVTLEPCIMCLGAILNARVGRLYFGAYNEKYGAAGSNLDLTHRSPYHRIDAFGGILEDECAGLLKDFFKTRR